MAKQLLLGEGLLIIEDSSSRTDTPQFLGLFWTSDRTDAVTSA